MVKICLNISIFKHSLIPKLCSIQCRIFISEDSVKWYEWCYYVSLHRWTLYLLWNTRNGLDIQRFLRSIITMRGSVNLHHAKFKVIWRSNMGKSKKLSWKCKNNLGSFYLFCRQRISKNKFEFSWAFKKI